MALLKRVSKNGRGGSLYRVMVNEVIETARVETFARPCLRATQAVSSQRCSLIVRENGCGGSRHSKLRSTRYPQIDRRPLCWVV